MNRRLLQPYCASPKRALRRPAVAAFLILSWPAAAFAQSGGEAIVRGWLDTIRASGATVDVGGIAYSQGADRLDVTNLKIVPPGAAAKGGGAIRVPRITFEGLSERSGGGLQARSMTSSTIEASDDAGTFRLTVSGVEAHDVALPSFAGLRVDPARPLSSQIAALREVVQLQAGTFQIGRVAFDGRNAGEAVSFAYDGLTVADVSQGRIGRITSGPIAVTVSAPAGQDVPDRPIDIRIGQAEALDYDIEAYLRVFDAAAYVGGRGDGVWREVQRSAVLDGISVSVGTAKFALARASVGAIRMRQFDEPLTDLLDRISSDPHAIETDPVAGAKLGFGVLGAIALDSYSLDGWSIEGPDLDHALIGRVSLKDLSGAGLGEFAIDGVDAATKDGSIKLGGFSFGRLAFPSAAAIQAAIEAQAAGTPFDPTSLAPTLGFLKLDGLDVDVPQKGTVTLGAFALDFADYIKAIPTKARMTLRNFSAPASLADDASARDVLMQLGLDPIDLSADMSLRWDEQTSDFRVETVSASLAGAGSVAINAVLGGVPRALFEHPESAADHLVGVVLRGFGVTYRDASLVNRLIEYTGLQSGQSPDQVRKGLIAGLPALVKDVRDQALRKRIVDAATTFLKAPRSFGIVSRPAAPVPLVQIIGTVATAPQQLPNVLQITVTANQ